VRIAEELGVDVDVVVYQKTPPDRTALQVIVDRLEDPVTNLVRRDSLWEKLGLRDEDVQTADQVIDVILKHKMIMQRPVVVTDKKAIIGRPKERVRELLGG
jgi:arsenate reductase